MKLLLLEVCVSLNDVTLWYWNELPVLSECGCTMIALLLT
jgi:hypothetical protein